MARRSRALEEAREEAAAAERSTRSAAADVIMDADVGFLADVAAIARGQLLQYGATLKVALKEVL